MKIEREAHAPRRHEPGRRRKYGSARARGAFNPRLTERRRLFGVPTALLVGALFSFAHQAALAGTSDYERDVSACAVGGRSEIYGHGSNACWRVYATSSKRGDYAAALEAVRMGCERHKRSDFCMFWKHWGMDAASIREAATYAQKYRIRQAAERAEAFVTDMEIEDVEEQLVRNDLTRAVEKRQRREAGKGRIAANAAGRAASGWKTP